ncbi:MAG TPA: GerMN domain-containing protein [Candidatus Paceibacterota bacterium]
MKGLLRRPLFYDMDIPSRTFVGVITAIVSLFAGAYLLRASNVHAPTVPPQPETMTIKIPLLVDASDTHYEGAIIGCDKVVMVDKTVPKTADILTAALHELFARKNPWEPWAGTPSNFLSAHTELVFDHATVERGVATIYLTGRIGPLGGVCDDPRTRTELEQTALQFPTIQSVQFYLDGEPTTLQFSEKGQ